MSREHVRLRNLLQLLRQYNWNQPLHLYLQEQFRLNKSWGSGDRRFYREWIYAYMRLGASVTQLTPERAFLLLALMKNEQALFETWSGGMRAAQGDIKTVFPEYHAEEWFPEHSKLSSAINTEAFRQHHQGVLPVFARILPLAEKGTMNLPEGAELLPEGALSIPSGTDLSYWIGKGLLQIQDLGSQWVCRQILTHYKGGLFWDACCGSGGKSMYYASDISPEHLICSDIRPGILDNLMERFQLAHLPLPRLAQVDLAQPVVSIDFSHAGQHNFHLQHHSADHLALDVPCSGSGTWGRNPEMLHPEFLKTNVAEYARRQRNILQNSLPFLRPGGKLYYSTCSVYRSENEDNAAYCVEELGLELLTSEYFDGSVNHSDYLYLAVFQKPV